MMKDIHNKLLLAGAILIGNFLIVISKIRIILCFYVI